MADSDIVWRRPEPDKPPQDRYEGPPGAAPMPTELDLPVEELTPPARRLPPLDHDAIDDAEQRAARVTYAVCLTAAAIMVLLVCRRLF